MRESTLMGSMFSNLTSMTTHKNETTVQRNLRPRKGGWRRWCGLPCWGKGVADGKR